MAIDILSTTTLSEALDASTTNFTVASTTNITAGQLLVANGEALDVQAVDDPSSGYVKVRRGSSGTKAISHANSERVFIGNHHDFKAIRESAVALVGDSGVFPDYMLPGQEASDAKGNTYVLVEMTTVVYSGTTCVISVDGNYTAAILATGTHGSVGIATEQATSDQYTWLLRKGYYSAALEAGGTSAGSSAYFPVAATSVSTPAAGMAVVVTSNATLGFTIHGMFIAGAAVSTTTSTTSNTGITVPVFLNYPWVEAAAPGSS